MNLKDASSRAQCTNGVNINVSFLFLLLQGLYRDTIDDSSYRLIQAVHIMIRNFKDTLIGCECLSKLFFRNTFWGSPLENWPGFGQVSDLEPSCQHL